MRSLKLFLFGSFCLALATQMGLAQGNGNGHGKGNGKNKHQQFQDDDDNSAGSYERGGIQIVFSTRDRDVIRDYYQDQDSNLPPGLAKRGGNLPPGLQKHLERDGTLPPGLQKRIHPFPAELERRLPPLPDGYRRVTLGVDILILDRRTQRIVDIVRDILRP
jgi:hypothetical protein